MASIILPSQYRQQPQQVVGIDTGNPLAKGLVDAWNGANPLFHSSFGTPQALTQTGGLSKVYSSLAGAGAGFDGLTQYISRNGSAITNTVEATLLVIALPLNTSAATKAIFGYGNSATANTILFVGQGNTSGQLSFFARSDANTQQILQVTAPSVWGSGVPCTIVGTRSESKNYHRLYCNGVSLSPTTATALGTSTFNRTTVGALVRNSPGLNWTGNVYLALSWNRALDESEVQAITANPWQVFKTPTRRLWADVSVSTNDLVVASSTQSNSSSSVSITQDQTLTVAGSVQANSSSSVVITQDHVLVVSASSQANSSSSVAVSEDHVLAVSGSSQVNSSSSVAVTQDQVLVVSGSTQVNSSQSVAITQEINLSVSSASQATTSSSATVTQVHILSVATSTQANSSSSVAISSGGTLIVAGSSQANSSSSVGITQQHNISVSASTTNNSSSSVAITQTHRLSISSCSESNSSASAAITKVHELTVDPEYQNGEVSEVTLIISTVPGITKSLRVSVVFEPYYIALIK